MTCGKRFLVWVEDKVEGKSAQQYLAGGLPHLTDKVKPATFVLDGETDKELLYKLLINVAATYFKASSVDDKEFLNKLANWKTEFREWSQKND
jgi:hypothetical protein